MSAESIVQFCAPTLAGIKVGSLFSARYENESSVRRFLEEQNRQLSRKGVRMVALKVADGLALFYVYRRRQLHQVLLVKENQDFLEGCGYTEFLEEHCLDMLRDRLRLQDFPHEIGVFLGYPLDDIKEFIRHKGCDCPCQGCWKAYTNLESAKRTFEQYRTCTRLYCEWYDQGADIARLTVAG